MVGAFIMIKQFVWSGISIKALSGCLNKFKKLQTKLFEVTPLTVEKE